MSWMGVLVLFFIAVIKYPDPKPHREDKDLFAVSPRLQPVIAANMQRQVQLDVSHPQSRAYRNKGTKAACFLLACWFPSIFLLSCTVQESLPRS